MSNDTSSGAYMDIIPSMSLARNASTPPSSTLLISASSLFLVSSTVIVSSLASSHNVHLWEHASCKSGSVAPAPTLKARRLLSCHPLNIASDDRHPVGPPHFIHVPERGYTSLVHPSCQRLLSCLFRGDFDVFDAPVQHIGQDFDQLLRGQQLVASQGIGLTSVAFLRQRGSRYGRDIGGVDAGEAPRSDWVAHDPLGFDRGQPPQHIRHNMSRAQQGPGHPRGFDDGFSVGEHAAYDWHGIKSSAEGGEIDDQAHCSLLACLHHLPGNIQANAGIQQKDAVNPIDCRGEGGWASQVAHDPFDFLRQAGGFLAAAHQSAQWVPLWSKLLDQVISNVTGCPSNE